MLKQVLDGLVGENLCPIVDHLGESLKRRVLCHRLREEEGPAEASAGRYPPPPVPD